MFSVNILFGHYEYLLLKPNKYFVCNDIKEYLFLEYPVSHSFRMSSFTCVIAKLSDLPNTGEGQYSIEVRLQPSLGPGVPLIQERDNM